MAFSLSDAAKTFTRLMEALFDPKVWPNIMVYLDDVIVITETLEEHLKLVEYALRRIVDASLQVNPDKCEFCCSQVSLMGYLLNAEGLRPDSARIDPQAGTIQGHYQSA